MACSPMLRDFAPNATLSDAYAARMAVVLCSLLRGSFVPLQACWVKMCQWRELVQRRHHWKGDV